MKRVAIIPNFNTVTAEDLDGSVEQGVLDLSDLNLEGVHAVQYDVEAGTVVVEYIQPANERMTVEEFHEYFGTVTAKKGSRKRRAHLDEAVAAGQKAHDDAREARRRAKEEAESV